MTIFCPSCGTANRDDTEMCTECGNIIPKLDDSVHKSPLPTPTPADFGIVESYPPPPTTKPIAGYHTAYTAYDSYSVRSGGQRIICERCGTVLRSDAIQCSGCGKPIQSPQQSPHPPPPPLNSHTPYPPLPPPPPINKPSPSQPVQTRPSTAIAKCSKCGAIVYDYETRCNNCGRILAPPTKQPKEPASNVGRTPPGAARCSRCNAIVYPHHTICPNCSKSLTPIPVDNQREPSQRISRCKRCGNTVYPTDIKCSNCGRKLDPV